MATATKELCAQGQRNPLDQVRSLIDDAFLQEREKRLGFRSAIVAQPRRSRAQTISLMQQGSSGIEGIAVAPETSFHHRAQPCKKVFQVHAVDADGKVVVARKLGRKEVLAFWSPRLHS
jgi:hypothetical protein